MKPHPFKTVPEPTFSAACESAPLRKITGAVLLALVLLAGCSGPRTKPATSWSQATGGENLERMLWREIKDKHWTELERHLAPLFVSTGPGGRFDRAGTIEHLKALNISDYSLSDIQVEPHGADMVVTYTITLRGSFNGQPIPETPERMLTVWQQLKGGWFAIAHADAGRVTP